MSYIAQASRLISVPAEVAFDCLADHDSWATWMPESFRPFGRSLGRLCPGMKFRVRILGSPLPVGVGGRVVDRARELTWGGGVPGVFLAEHRFLFEPRGDSSVEVRSVETWSGVIPRLLRRTILPSSERVGNDQLAALDAASQARRAGRS